MSTISIMPIGKKMRIKRATKMSASTIGAKDGLEAAGMLLGDWSPTLILDENTIIRVDAFSSTIAQKSYPSVKMSIFPEGYKMGQVYVSLDSLDGITWEIVEEDAKKIPVITKRIDIEWNSNYTNYMNIVYVDAFGTRFNMGDNPCVVNPLKLEPNELKTLSMDSTSTHECGSAIIKIGRDSHKYKFQYLLVFHFLLEKGPEPLCLLQARFDRLDISLQIGAEYNYKGDYETLWAGTNLNFVQTDHEILVKNYLKEKYKI